MERKCCRHRAFRNLGRYRIEYLYTGSIRAEVWFVDPYGRLNIQMGPTLALLRGGYFVSARMQKFPLHRVAQGLQLSVDIWNLFVNVSFVLVNRVFA